LGKSASLELGAGSSSTPTRDGAGGAVSEHMDKIINFYACSYSLVTFISLLAEIYVTKNISAHF